MSESRDRLEEDALVIGRTKKYEKRLCGCHSAVGEITREREAVKGLPERGGKP